MLYPVYVHMGDEKHAHGVTIPDFPGCFSAADAWEMIPAMVQEAAEVHFDGEAMDIPPPSPLEDLTGKEEFQGGVWMLVEIDTARIRPKSLRINVERSFARPGDRWVEVGVRVTPTGKGLKRARLEAAVFSLGRNQPAATASCRPTQERGKVLVDLRRAQLDTAAHAKPHAVATDVDVERFFEHFFSILEA